MRSALLSLSLIGLIATTSLPNTSRQASLSPRQHRLDRHANSVAGSIVPCRSDDGHQAGEPTGVEDRRIRGQVLAQGVKLLTEGEVSAVELLQKELARDHCRLDLPSAATPAKSIVDLYRQSRESVVVVAGVYKCPNCGRHHVSTASGFVISASGAIATNYHVVESKTNEALVVHTAAGYTYPVKSVLAASKRNDVAIIRIDAPNLVPLPLAASRSDAPIGSAAHVISHPAEHYFTLTSGVVSRYVSTRNRAGRSEAMDITADYAKGSSGAPVLNDQGQVVGIVMRTESIYYSETDGVQKNLQMVFKTCVPVESLRQLIDPPT